MESGVVVDWLAFNGVIAISIVEISLFTDTVPSVEVYGEKNGSLSERWNI